MFNRKGQNTAEYAILIALVVAAAVAMQVYVRRGLQGRVADAVDYTGPVGSPIAGTPLNFTTRQYEPYYQQSSRTTVSNRGYSENVVARGGTARTGNLEATNLATGSYEAATWNASSVNFNAR